MNTVFLILASLFFTTKPLLVERAFFVMGSVIEFKVYCEKEKDACNEAIFDAYSEVKKLDDMLSDYKPDSKLSEVNSLAGKGKISIPPEFIELAERSLFFSNLADRAFDVTVGKLIKLWRESQKKNVIPDIETVKRTVSECTGSDKMKIYPEESKIELKSGCISIDFGGIGKGYAVDKAISILKKQGIKSALVSFSGNMYALGAPPGEKGWEVGVQNPINKGELLTSIFLKDIAVSTSGDYEKYFEIEGKRFSHIVNPKTGLPVESVPSVTIIARNATDADALSTAVSVLGKDGAIQVLKKFDTSVMILTKEKDGLSIYKDETFKKLEVPNTH